MPGLVYILCAVTSLISAILLLRGARPLAPANGLLFWSSMCFFGMTANNVLLYLNFVVFPEIDLMMAARLTTLIAVLLLNFGLIWHTP